METVKPFIDLVAQGGAVLIALVVLSAMIYLGYRYIVAPFQRQQRAIAEAHSETAHQNALAACAHQEASKYNSQISEANQHTAAHLDNLMQMMIDAINKKK